MIRTLISSSPLLLAGAGYSESGPDSIQGPEDLFDSDCLYDQLAMRANKVRQRLEETSSHDGLSSLWTDTSVRKAFTLLLGNGEFAIEPHIRGLLELDEMLQFIEFDEQGNAVVDGPLELSAELFFQTEAAILIQNRLAVALSKLHKSSLLVPSLEVALDIASKIRRGVEAIHKLEATSMPSSQPAPRENVYELAAPDAVTDELNGEEVTDAEVATTSQVNGEYDEPEFEATEAIAAENSSEEEDYLDGFDDADFASPDSQATSDLANILNDRSRAPRSNSPSVLPASTDSVRFGLPPDAQLKLKSFSSRPPAVSHGEESIPLGRQLIQGLIVCVDVLLQDQSD